MQIDIDFQMKFPMAKNMKMKWSFCESNIFNFLKSKISSPVVLKILNKPELSTNSGNININ